MTDSKRLDVCTKQAMVEILRDLLVRQPANTYAVSLAAQAFEHGGSRTKFCHECNV